MHDEQFLEDLGSGPLLHAERPACATAVRTKPARSRVERVLRFGEDLLLTEADLRAIRRTEEFPK